jgi:hypothetical protein
VDGVERTVGDPGVGDASALATPRSRLGGLTREQRAAEFSVVVRGFFRAKAQRFSADGGDACGCRIPLGGVVVVILPALRLRVKTLDLMVSMTVCVVILLGASSWSPDSTRFCFFVFVVLVFPCYLFFIFDLLCKRFSSPPCIGSAVGCYIIYSGAKASFEEVSTLASRTHSDPNFKVLIASQASLAVVSGGLVQRMAPKASQSSS